MIGMCEGMLAKPSATLGSVPVAHTRNKLLSLWEKSPYFATSRQKNVMVMKIDIAIREWKKRKKSEIAAKQKKRYNSPGHFQIEGEIDMTEKLARHARSLQLVAVEGASLPVDPLPTTIDETDRIAHEIFGLTDAASMDIGRVESRSSHVMFALAPPARRWVDDGHIDQVCWEKIQHWDPKGDLRTKVFTFSSFALLQNAVEAHSSLDSVVVGSIDTTHGVTSNDWKLGAIGGYSSNNEGGNSFVPYAFFLCEEENTISALIASASLRGTLKKTYGFTLQFKAGNVSDSASAFRHMWDSVFPDSPRAACWVHFKVGWLCAYIVCVYIQVAFAHLPHARLCALLACLLFSLAIFADEVLEEQVPIPRETNQELHKVCHRHG